MLKQCIIFDGNIINIGEWDYDIDGEGVINNPIPDGATIEQRDFEFTDENGWREIGIVIPKTPQEQIAELQAIVNILLARLQ